MKMTLGTKLNTMQAQQRRERPLRKGCEGRWKGGLKKRKSWEDGNPVSERVSEN